jgi:hypothetical protein
MSSNRNRVIGSVGWPKFACDDCPKHFAQLCGAPWTKSGFKSRLGL